MNGYHSAVLLEESISGMNLKKNGIYVDATLGGGGHTLKILESNQNLQVFAFDQDEDAIDYTSKIYEQYSDRLKIFNDNFSNLRTRLSLERIKKIDGIIFDLGVSFHQISNPLRGFSYQHDGKLDMRMNKSEKISAYDIINKFPYEKMRTIFFDYGEERESNKIAREIVESRKKKMIRTTGELSEIIEKSIRSHQKLKAKARIFQALRIFINNEINVLKTTLNDAVNILNPGGRLAVLTYHSIEDRIVKKFFQYQEKSCICPPGFPKCVCNKKSTLKIITKKPIVPSIEEIKSNKMARSAKLRIAEKKGEVDEI